MDLKDRGVSTKNWIDSAQNKNYWRVIVNAALNAGTLVEDHTE